MFLQRFLKNSLSNCYHIKLNQINVCKYSSKTSSQPSNLDYCIQLVRKYDHENFLCILLLPKQYQAPSFILRAFNIEIAKVQDNVSDINIGNARLQFWENAIDKLYTDNVPAHPVIEELNKLNKLSKRNLKRLVTSRISILKTKSFKNLEELEAYAENVVSCIYYLQLQTAGISDLQADHCLSHIGKAQGICNILRSVPYLPRTTPLPIDILAQHKVSQEMIIRKDTSQNTKDVMFQIASSAKVHLDKARSLKSKLPKQVLPFCLHSIPTDSYLYRLRSADFNVFHLQLKVTDGFLPLKLWWNSIKKNY